MAGCMPLCARCVGSRPALVPIVAEPDHSHSENPHRALARALCEAGHTCSLPHIALLAGRTGSSATATGTSGLPTAARKAATDGPPRAQRSPPLRPPNCARLPGIPARFPARVSDRWPCRQTGLPCHASTGVRSPHPGAHWGLGWAPQAPVHGRGPGVVAIASSGRAYDTRVPNVARRPTHGYPNHSRCRPCHGTGGVLASAPFPPLNEHARAAAGAPAAIWSGRPRIPGPRRGRRALGAAAVYGDAGPLVYRSEAGDLLLVATRAESVASPSALTRPSRGGVCRAWTVPPLPADMVAESDPGLIDVGAHHNIFVGGASPADDYHPVLQVLEYQYQGDKDHYRVELSDTKEVVNCMLATGYNDMIKANELRQGSLIRCNNYYARHAEAQGPSKYLVLINIEVVGFISRPIGSPKKLDNEPYPPSRQESEGLYKREPYGGEERGYPGARPNNGYQKENGYQKDNSYYGGGHPGKGYANNGPGSQRGAPFGQLAGAGGLPPSRYSNQGPIARNEGGGRILPISQLNPYSNRWTIKARVTQRSEPRSWNRNGRQGRVCSVELLDEHGGEIRCTLFTEAIDKHYDVLERGNIVLVSGGNVKPKNAQFNHTKHEFEIVLDVNSRVELSLDEIDIPCAHFDFVPIRDVVNVPVNSLVDVIGVVENINPPGTIIRRDGGQEVAKQTLNIRDSSNVSVEICLWGAKVEEVGSKLESEMAQGHSPILAIKGGKVSDFGGTTIGTSFSSLAMIDPDVKEGHQLRGWYEQEGGRTMRGESISNTRSGGGGMRDRRVTVSQIKDEGLGMSGKPDYVIVKGTVSFIRQEKLFYPADPETKKKLTRQGEGEMWWSEHKQMPVEKPVWRYTMNFQLADHTGQTFVTAFDDAEAMLGRSAEEMQRLSEMQDRQFEETLQKALFAEGLFKLRVAEDTYNDEKRVKCTLQKYEPINFEQECQVLLNNISKLEQGLPIDPIPEVKATSTPATNIQRAPPVDGGYGQSSGYGTTNVSANYRSEPYGGSNGYNTGAYGGYNQQQRGGSYQGGGGYGAGGYNAGGDRGYNQGGWGGYGYDHTLLSPRWRS
eukprot:scaffold3734_cov425-Prasinococcus_capsulatus_cf.AAC.5